ncbi:unnamed protein product [Blepharisma stoltei]|uniref:HSF-type DNA-binding domain-containing protein n=1 Tax=Blepharisma stoltei TaxID=1481888 RepID=A0AAU9IHA8_9CILI|nr:unnamed protein product [Blepharisma stoltei]
MMNRKRSKSARPTSFLSKTFDLLSLDEFQDIVCWSDDGKSFTIKNQGEFMNQVLPIYFKHKNLASFIRQLNMYDFHKVRDSGDKQIFSHPCFVKGNKSLLVEIHRKTSEFFPPPVARIIQQASEPLLQKCQMLEAKQVEMQNALDTLDKKYKETCEMNQTLVVELLNAREREERLSQMIFSASLYGAPFNMI